MTILAILKWVLANHKSLFKAICGLSVGLLLAWGITLSKQNKKLSESLEMALNNIEAYLGIVNDSLLANNVLRLDIKTLHQLNDKLLQLVDSVRKELNIKPNQVTTAATQNQILHVNSSKGVGGDLIEILKDTVYKDSINFNPLTVVYYTIGKDTVNIDLNVSNTQYLFLYSAREYKNKKNFIKRLFTLDFKKINKYKYSILNTNELFDIQDIRIIESNKNE